MSTYPSRDIERAAAAFGQPAPLALIQEVAPFSPADDAGFEPGCALLSVDGQPLRDIIDWRWLASDDAITVGYVDLDGDRGEVELEREPGEDWGFQFDGVVFDGVKQCRNACTFCFMRMLPPGMRPSLTLRDDDFRLSFLAGTFVTFTNLTAEDEARIIEQRISPLRVSLHATDADARRALIGKHAAHGLAAIDRLLAAGIRMHAQIVLVPQVNDGDVLRRTLQWAYERPGVENIGIVPLGYTRFQQRFDHSFNQPTAAQEVLDTIKPLQERVLAERGTPWVYAADEFYRNAFGPRLLENLPPAGFYGDFSMFEDGIGIIRSFADDWAACVEDGLVDSCARALRAANLRVLLVIGCAQLEFFPRLVAASALDGWLVPFPVENAFFGGNVDVTGLLCGCDVARALAAADVPQGALACLTQVTFNDDGIMLDGMTLEDVETEAGLPVAVVSCTASDFLPQIAEIAATRG